MNAPEDYFPERVAATYDDDPDICGPGAVDAVAGVLAELAGGGRALELGIGTGRIALPLAARGVEVHGIDLSEAMVARLKAKPGATRSRPPSATSPRPRRMARSRLCTWCSTRS